MELDKRGMILIVFFILIMLLSLEIYASSLDSDSADNSEWLMFGRYLNGTRTYSNLSLKPVDHLLWTYDLSNPENGMRGPAAVANGMVYAGLYDNHKIVAINATTGVEIWSYTVAGAEIEGAPAVANNTVFIGSMGSKALYALDAITGNYLWNFTNTSLIDGSPAVSNGRVYIMNVNTIFALNITNGAWIWNNTCDGGIYASPSIVGDIVYAAGRAYNATNGSIIWNGNVGTSSNPAIANDIVYITGVSSKAIYAFNATNGTKIWEYTTGGSIYSSPAVANGIVYFGSRDNKVYALNATDANGGGLSGNGTLIWSYTTLGPVESSPLIVNDIVYIGCGNAKDGKFYSLNANTGALIWSYTPVGSFPILTPPVIANNIIYVAAFDKGIYAFDYLENNYICSDTDACEYDTLSNTLNGALSGENNTGNIVYFLENDTNYFIDPSTSYTNVSMQFVNNANLVIDCNKTSLNSTGSLYIFNFTNAINITIANCSFYNNPIYIDNLSYNITLYHNSFHKDMISGQKDNITGCFGGLGNFYDYRISNNSMLNRECGLINITQPAPNITISGAGASVTIAWSNQSSYNITLAYLIQTYFNNAWINLTTVQDDNYTWNPTQEGNYTINIIPKGSEGTYRNSTVLISFQPGPGGGCSGCGEEETTEEEETEEEETEEEIPEDMEPDPIEDIDVIVEPDNIIVDFITEAGIETKLSLILDDVGLLKKKPRLKIDFKIPEIKGESRTFKMFDWVSLIIDLSILASILFLMSFYDFVKLGHKFN